MADTPACSARAHDGPVVEMDAYRKRSADRRCVEVSTPVEQLGGSCLHGAPPIASLSRLRVDAVEKGFTRVAPSVRVRKGFLGDLLGRNSDSLTERGRN